MYKKILVPLDGTEFSELAIQHLVDNFCRGTVVHLLSVVEEDHVLELAEIGNLMGSTVPLSTTQPSAGHRLFNPVEIKQRETYLQHLGQRLEETGYKVEIDVHCGKPVEIISRTAKDHFDLVVMASHSRTGLGKLLLGSVAEGVLHTAPCPVLIIPAAATSLV